MRGRKRLERRNFNPKRRFNTNGLTGHELMAKLAKIRYNGNAEHKRNPGDFGLRPPLGPRPSKTLCDSVGIFEHSQALELLREGFRRCMFSAQERDGWPQNVWAVTHDGKALEAQLEGGGVYHGYPMAETDPFAVEVLARWSKS